MTTRKHMFRPLMAIAALLLCAAIFNASSQNAQANCCSITIDNQTGCRFVVCLIPSATTRCDTIVPGVNIIPLPTCPAPRFEIRDICGIVHQFPSLAICDDFLVGGAAAVCCIHICQTGPCTWTVTPGNCHPCVN